MSIERAPENKAIGREKAARKGTPDRAVRKRPDPDSDRPPVVAPVLGNQAPVTGVIEPEAPTRG